jgi:ribosomal-protein-alanine N-acetyltransferase
LSERILAADTALGACSVVILDGEKILAHRREEMNRGHAEALAPMVEDAMRGSGLAFADLGRLAVTTGPGTFTGQRVGLAFMRGLRVALNKPLLGVTTLAAIHAACFPDAWSVKALADLLATPGTFAGAGDTGFILARAAAGEAEILTLAVAPAARRHGTGAVLVQAAANEAQRLGAEVFFLEVASGNAAARALYNHLGFTEAGLRKGYYALPGRAPEDALVLRADLPLVPLGKSPAAG